MDIKSTKENEEKRHLLADHLRQNRSDILQRWQNRARSDRSLNVATTLSSKEFLDHIPDILDALDTQLRNAELENACDAATRHREELEAHGLSRWQQGFTIAQVVRDWNHLRCAILDELSRAVTLQPEWSVEPFGAALRTLADLISEGINLSVEKYEQIRQDEARSHSQDLETTIQDLRQLCDSQSKRYAEASHDLASHLGILSNIARMVAQNGQSSNGDSLNEHLAEGFERALKILEDIRYHNSLESGENAACPENVDAAKLIETTLSPYAVVADSKSINLKVDGPSALAVETDPAKFSRILQNLVHNALKFTRDGDVSIQWELHPAEKAWSVSVRNSGPFEPSRSAIPIAEQMELASRANEQINGFHRPDDAVDDSQPPDADSLASSDGDSAPLSYAVQREGIGLSIAKRLTNLLLGRLEIESDDESVTARVTLPMAFSESKTDLRIRR
ncbi:sensor histidine kinase [Pelagicoccus sp. SDUM812003]|uniref:sensor histidine kinase n=1 Tax=Pelagicoccus sp. SDUM812003 TaxID=3041267 RepID=UPI002810822A|nr:sensor histidine kinase [Pelagicoccus sp. SDUM812003]MDQ8203998.1 sensor histidine kinase [Pelagicoccus sp. SDUM812003]